MEYYRLNISNEVINPIQIEGLDPNYYKNNYSIEDYEKLPEGLVAFYEYTEDMEFPAVVTKPTLLVNTELRDVLQIYKVDYIGKSVKVFAKDRKVLIAPTYWAINYEELECLSEQVEWNSNGTVKKLILKRNAISDKHIFKVKGTLENFIIVSMAVAESILRRKIYGVGFEKVEVI